MMNDNANGNITLLTFVDSCGQFGIKALETLKTSHAMIPVYSNVGCDLKKPLKMLVIRTGKRHYEKHDVQRLFSNDSTIPK